MRANVTIITRKFYILTFFLKKWMILFIGMAIIDFHHLKKGV